MTFSHFSLRRTRTMATLSRSLFLLRSFGYEQSDPAYFYGNLAEDTAQFIASLYSDRVVGGAPAAALHNARILDVGGGPGFFSEAFTARGSTYITVEPDVGEMAAANIEVPGSVRGSGDALPFADASFDIVYSSNVAEHMPNPWDMGDEMLRVTRPGGLVVLSYTIWLGPFGGHETGLWQHYIGGNFVQESGTASLVGLIPRYHPRWAWWLVHVPGVREFLVSNLAIVLRKNEANAEK